jgi:hypothetical protein
MPPIVAEPVAEVHDCLVRIQAALRSEFGVKAVFAQRLYDAQQDLGRAMIKTIPVFVLGGTEGRIEGGDAQDGEVVGKDLVLPEVAVGGRTVVYAEGLFQAVKAYVPLLLRCDF